MPADETVDGISGVQSASVGLIKHDLTQEKRVTLTLGTNGSKTIYGMSGDEAKEIGEALISLSNACEQTSEEGFKEAVNKITASIDEIVSRNKQKLN